MHRGDRRSTIMQELVSFAVKQAEAQGADDAEAFAATLSESEVFLE